MIRLNTVVTMYISPTFAFYPHLQVLTSNNNGTTNPADEHFLLDRVFIIE